MHYGVPEMAYPLCQEPIAKNTRDITTDVSKVTCKRCLKFLKLGQKGKEDRR